MFGNTDIKVIENNEKQNNKVKSKRKNLSFEERVNAEFKHLNKRIKRLEHLVLQSTIDRGSINEPTKLIKKG